MSALLPSDLSRLRTLRTWHVMWVERIDEAIAAAEQRQRERQQDEDRRPPTPDWIVELSIGVGARPIEVHVGGCHAAGKRHRAITREQALAALADGIRACIHCRPDRAWGAVKNSPTAAHQWRQRARQDFLYFIKVPRLTAGVLRSCLRPALAAILTMRAYCPYMRDVWCGDPLTDPVGAGRRPYRPAQRQAAWRARRRWKDAAQVRRAMTVAGVDLLVQVGAVAVRVRETPRPGLAPGWHSAAVAQVPGLAGQLVRLAVLADRRAGASWAQIGAGLGISAEAARGRFGRVRAAASAGGNG
ncbi:MULTISPECIES: DUF6233 domain-containing protein [unclassified Streptomyces]|uniref:DUF6233 domain-containing protein n=1 Tax=unclassified Streptomyces TaxID=2593676 RepID=UPI0029A3DBF0|nr:MULTISPECIES: DUF6233 domain-containing protein [unclassified Streptomyces]MDX3766400.1 DUF6233 domain-containing protein [Streptomyces sp. AK08-01B]MDX3816344.1 DUF6233 domain-containing protein [Streptomyces sp. AK08-01A]